MGPLRACTWTNIFRIFISDTVDWIESALYRFAADTELIGASDSAEGLDVIPRDLDSLEEWALVSLIKYNKVKCKIMHLGQGNPLSVQTWGIESCPVEEDLGSW